MDRDTQKCAYKCSYAVINGEGVDVFKQPVTDPGKTSKKGRLSLIHTADGSFSTVRAKEADPKLVRGLACIFWLCLLPCQVNLSGCVCVCVHGQGCKVQEYACVYFIMYFTVRLFISHSCLSEWPLLSNFFSSSQTNVSQSVPLDFWVKLRS